MSDGATAALGSKLYACDLSIRWSDMDGFGHVNNALYLRYMEEARVRWLEDCAPDWATGAEGPVVANITIDYRRPIVWPATLRCTIHAVKAGRSSMTVQHQLIDANNGTLYAEASIVLVWISQQTGRSVALPEQVKRLFD
jgi:acyl-CoA thioester hydrolase